MLSFSYFSIRFVSFNKTFHQAIFLEKSLATLHLSPVYVEYLFDISVGKAVPCYIFSWGISFRFFGGKEWSRKIRIINGAMEPVRYSLQIFFR